MLYDYFKTGSIFSGGIEKFSNGGLLAKKSNFLKKVLTNEDDFKKLWQLEKDVRKLDKKFGVGATSGFQLHIHSDKKELEVEINNNNRYWEREFDEMKRHDLTQYLKQFRKMDISYQDYKDELMDELNTIADKVGKIGGYKLYGSIAEGTTATSDIAIFLINSSNYEYNKSIAKEYVEKKKMENGGGLDGEIGNIINELHSLRQKDTAKGGFSIYDDKYYKLFKKLRDEYVENFIEKSNATTVKKLYKSNEIRFTYNDSFCVFRIYTYQKYWRNSGGFNSIVTNNEEVETAIKELSKLFPHHKVSQEKREETQYSYGKEVYKFIDFKLMPTDSKYASGGALDRSEKTKRVSAFLDKFNENTTSWADATDELPTIHNHIAEYFPEYKGNILVSAGGDLPNEVKSSPSIRNKEHKSRILKLLPKLSDEHFDLFYSHFKEWFDKQDYKQLYRDWKSDKNWK